MIQNKLLEQHGDRRKIRGLICRKAADPREMILKGDLLKTGRKVPDGIRAGQQTDPFALFSHLDDKIDL